MPETKRKRKTPYSKGQLNFIIDSFLHPLAKKEAKIPTLLLDTCLHALAEQNLKESYPKFLKYTLPEIIEEYTKPSRKKKKQKKNKKLR